MLDMYFDIRTLSVVTVLFSLIFGVGFLFFSKERSIIKGANYIGIGLISVAVGSLLIAFRHLIPIIFSVVISNTCILGGVVLINLGLCRFWSLTTFHAFFSFFVLVAHCIVFVYFSYVTPSVSVRIISISTSLALVCLLCLKNIVIDDKQKQCPGKQLIVVGFVLFILYAIFRTIWTIQSGFLNDFMASGTVHGISFIIMIILCLHVSFGFLWCSSAILQDKIRIFERIISSTPDSILIVDKHGSYQYFNDAAINAFHQVENMFIGKSSRELFGNEFYNTITKPNLKKAFQGEVGQTSVWLNLPNGQRYFTICYHPVPNTNGIITLAAINIRDLTNEQLLQEDRQRIFDMSLDILCTIDMDGYLKEVSPACTQILGWNLDEVMNSLWLNIIHPDDVDDAVELKKVLMSGKQVVDFVNRCRTKDGSYRCISWMMQPDASTQLIYAVGRDVTDKKDLEEELKKQTITDPLTNIGNRRLFMQRSKEELERSFRYHTSLSLFMIDIDHFKNINDTYGHNAGDTVLKSLAETINNELRASDLFCRLGGEEFAVLLANTDIDAAMILAQRICKLLSASAVDYNKSLISFTVSIGVTSRSEGNDSIDSMLKRADDALYIAKKYGRDQVVINPPQDVYM